MKQIFLAIAALLTSFVSHAEEWNGHFKRITGQDEHGRYEQSIDITCTTNTACMARESRQINGQVIPAEPIFDGSSRVPLKTDIPFGLDEATTNMFRRSILDLANAPDLPHAPSYFKHEIYRQIGTPNHVLACRSNINLMICELDEPLVRDDYGNLTSWIILLRDMASSFGCPGYGCPYALTRQQQN